MSMPARGFEPPPLSGHGPKPCASANFATPAQEWTDQGLPMEFIRLWRTTYPPYHNKELDKQTGS